MAVEYGVNMAGTPDYVSLLVMRQHVLIVEADSDQNSPLCSVIRADMLLY